MSIRWPARWAEILVARGASSANLVSNHSLNHHDMDVWRIHEGNLHKIWSSKNSDYTKHDITAITEKSTHMNYLKTWMIFIFILFTYLTKEGGLSPVFGRYEHPTIQVHIKSPRIHMHAPPNPTCSRWYDHEWLKADYKPDSPPPPSQVKFPRRGTPHYY